MKCKRGLYFYFEQLRQVGPVITITQLDHVPVGDSRDRTDNMYQYDILETGQMTCITMADPRDRTYSMYQHDRF